MDRANAMPTLAEAQAIRDALFADDVPMHADILIWSHTQIDAYFSSGGVDVPHHPPSLSSQDVDVLHTPPRSRPSTISANLYNTQVAATEQVSERVICVRGQNPGFFTGPGTNTYIVGMGSRRVLIDAGDSGVSSYIELLQRTLRAFDATLSAILITHSHPDHIGGARDVARACGGDEPVSIRKVPWSGHDAGLTIENVSDGDELRIDARTTLRAYHTPGHAPDHVCWLLPEEGLLFSGDTILGAGTTIVPAHGGDMRLYLASLARLRDDPHGWCTICPGHGPMVTDGRRAVREYIEHRLQREAQILNELSLAQQSDCLHGRGSTCPHGGAADALQSARDLVESMYRDRSLSHELRMAATETVYSHLVWLRAKGRVRCDESDDPQRSRHGDNMRPSLDVKWKIA